MKKLIIYSTMFVILLFTVLFSACSFTDNGDGTVTKNGTGLVWQKCSRGLSGSGCNTGKATAHTWKDAISYCEDLSLAGRTDWRLPSINELQSIVADACPWRTRPAIDSGYFPKTELNIYWSSTHEVQIKGLAMGISFVDGGMYSGKKAAGYYVRCVSGP